MTVSNLTIAAALERIAAELPTVTAPTEGQLGYGRDLSCVTDCEDDFAEIGPDDPRIISQDQARRFQTPRGALIDDPDYGLDVCGRLHKPITGRELRQLQTDMVGECMKDERVDTVAVQLTFADGVLRAAVRTAPKDPRIATFTTVMRITKAAAEIEP